MMAFTPKKKRPAPTPPAKCVTNEMEEVSAAQSCLQLTANTENLSAAESSLQLNASTENVTDENLRRKIPLDESLVTESEENDFVSSNVSDESEVVYRRKIVPLSPIPTEDETKSNGFVGSCENLEQMKDDKEAKNRQRQSQSDSPDTAMPYLNKSSHGKWKRRKGPAPLPGFAVPQRRVLQMLPLQQIRHELEVIEVQQHGLEKQGVQLEKMIRERCEGTGDNRTTDELLQSLPNAKNPKEVEELILQLFELVNEKNELFRRQAELMYLRRAHRLEEEQADVEFEVRKLMMQPESNKTDSDKSREEELVARLVEIVQLRNEVVDCLEMDRLREAEEDLVK
jgi:hypothetical protein